MMYVLLHLKQDILHGLASRFFPDNVKMNVSNYLTGPMGVKVHSYATQVRLY